MFELLILAAVIYGIYYYRKEMRLERQKQKFDKAKKEIESLGRENIETLVSESQKKDMVELAGIARGYLTKFEMEIPPRLFESANKQIDQWVEEIKFGKLHELYELLLNTNKKRVFTELEQFINRSQ